MSKPEYSREELYQLVGQYDNAVSFFFKEGSEAYEKYGYFVTGFIEYSKEEREELEDNSGKDIHTYGRIRLKNTSHAKSEEFKLELSKNGFECADILKVSHIPFNRENKFRNEEPREITGIVEISLDDLSINTSELKSENLLANLYSKRLNRGEKLIDEEINELLGILLYKSEGSLPQYLVDKLDLTIYEIEDNPRIWYYYYKLKNKDEGLREEEDEVYNFIKWNEYLKRLKIIIDEIDTYTDLKLDDIPQEKLDLIFNELEEFKKERLLQMEIPIYWDFKSFTHIYLRHVEETQVGKYFKGKSNFQYKFEDIKKMIKQVLGTLKSEIKQHFKENGKNKFTRHGSMSVYFEGDYFVIDISSEGRLINFYKK